jgi:peptidyl-tRNA hydrolase, PTH1 family
VYDKHKKKLIVGLGNPGRTYAATRHNIGYSVVRALAREHSIDLTRERSAAALTGSFSIDDTDVILALPLTFMNVSGVAVRALCDRYALAAGASLVICDDLDLDFGRIKIRSRGSAGGHRGLVSIIQSLERQDFCRLRIGIGRPAADSEGTDYVLSPFGREEKKQVPFIIEEACAVCEMWITQGIVASMNAYNRPRV